MSLSKRVTIPAPEGTVDRYQNKRRYYKDTFNYPKALKARLLRLKN